MTEDRTSRCAETRPQCDGVAGPGILLVDDDSSVRNLVTRLLKLKGYSVFAADNGRSAIEVWNEHKEEIALLLTDVVMPQGISGRELAIHCQNERATLKVVYTSGYNVELCADNGVLREGIHFIQKPYRPEQLLELIAGLLNSNASPRPLYVAGSTR